jgi:hypothetical protein
MNINFAAHKSADQLASGWPGPIFAKLTELRQRYDPDGILALMSPAG